jgi:hypothetical protein
MAKSLQAPYAAGHRGFHWLKLKSAHTLDLVVIGVEWGSGRRKGFLSNLHLGARDPESGQFVMLGKTFKGLTDAMLRFQTEKLLALETHRDELTVYVRPELVVEIAFSDVQESPRYPAGLALRVSRGLKEPSPRQAGERSRHDRHGAGDLPAAARLSRRGPLCGLLRGLQDPLRVRRGGAPALGVVRLGGCGGAGAQCLTAVTV